MHTTISSSDAVSSSHISPSPSLSLSPPSPWPAEANSAAPSPGCGPYALGHLGSEQLMARLDELVARQSALAAELVAHVAEVDARRLYLDHACSSMFVYATDVLHLSESQAYRLICAGRLARRFPVVFELLADGKLHLASVCMLSAHLTADNASALLAEAVHLSKRKLQQLLAARFPSADVPSDSCFAFFSSRGRAQRVPGKARGGFWSQ
jgi:hypothetical protein